MRAIFLSYRRDDAEGEAGRLFDDLIHEFGADKVFIDVTGIEPGRDFRKVIDQNVSTCGVLLAMMGKGWIDAKDDTGRPRLDDPLDFVRLETASALKRDIPVIPVLVHGGRMPRPEQLPEDLRELAYRNAVELTHARWDSDVQLLIKALRLQVSGEREEAGVAKTEQTFDPPSGKSTARAPVETGVGGTTSAAPTRPTKRSWRSVVVTAAAAIVIAAGVIGTYEYKDAEEAKVRQAAEEAAAKQAAEDRRVAAAKKAAAAENCIQGYVWREASESDHVCVTPAVRSQVAFDNGHALERRAGAGAYGPDTCKQGYVWRDAFPGDHVCVEPSVREQAANDNRQVQNRLAISPTSK